MSACLVSSYNTEVEIDMGFASNRSLTLSVVHTSLFPPSLSSVARPPPSWLITIKQPQCQRYHRSEPTLVSSSRSSDCSKHMDPQAPMIFTSMGPLVSLLRFSEVMRPV